MVAPSLAASDKDSRPGWMTNLTAQTPDKDSRPGWMTNLGGDSVSSSGSSTSSMCSMSEEDMRNGWLTRHDANSNKIIDRIYIGNKNAAQSKAHRDATGITHVLTVTNSRVDIKDLEKEDLEEYKETLKFSPTAKWLTLALYDNPVAVGNDEITLEECHKDFNKHFPIGYEWIKTKLKENGGENDNKILIHCDSGMNRSVAFTMAYLMKRASQEEGGPEWLKGVSSKFDDKSIFLLQTLGQKHFPNDKEFIDKISPRATQFMNLVCNRRSIATPQSSPYLPCAVLPVGWQEVTDKDGETIYVHLGNGRATIHAPICFSDTWRIEASPSGPPTHGSLTPPDRRNVVSKEQLLTLRLRSEESAAALRLLVKARSEEEVSARAALVKKMAIEVMTMAKTTADAMGLGVVMPDINIVLDRMMKTFGNQI